MLTMCGVNYVGYVRKICQKSEYLLETVNSILTDILYFITVSIRQIFISTLDFYFLIYQLACVRIYPDGFLPDFRNWVVTEVASHLVKSDYQTSVRYNRYNRPFAEPCRRLCLRHRDHDRGLCISRHVISDPLIPSVGSVIYLLTNVMSEYTHAITR